MADEKKMRTRLSSDGYDYPYTHPSLVLDENAESVTTKIDNINNTIGKNKIPGTPEVLEHYELSDSSNPDALEVVDDSVSPADKQITVTDANLNNSGTPFVATNYVVHVDAVASVPEVPASGLYKYIDTAILNAQLSGEEVDLSGYQTKSDADLETDDKTIIGAINALNTDSHMHIAYTQEEIEQLFDATPEEVAYWESMIQDQTISTNRLFSSKGVMDRITEAILSCQKYSNDLVGNLSMVKAKKVETKPDTGIELTIYLVGNDTAGYHQWMFIEGAWADLGSTNITLNGYITEEKLTEELAKKADDDKVLKLDKVTTTMSSTPSNDNVLSELAIKNLLDGKADSTSIPTNVSELTNDSGYITSSDIPSIPTVTNDLTDDLKANYDAAYTHSQTTHFDGDYNSLTNKPTIPTVTTTIGSSSTDTQVPSAKSIYNKSKNKITEVLTNRDIITYADSITPESVTDTVRIMNGTNSPYGTDNIDNDFYYTIYNIPENNRYKRIVAYDIRGNDMYMNIKRNDAWLGWTKVCTTKISDVATTVTTFENADVSGYVKYYVKNGICYVTLWPVQSTSTGTGKKLLSNMPIPLSADTGTGLFYANGDGTSTAFSYVDLNGNLYAHFYKTNTESFGTFSYPVKES